MNRTVLVDMDGVIADWSQTVFELAAEIAEVTGYTGPLPHAGEQTVFDVRDCWSGPQLYLVRAAMAHPELYQKLPPIEGAIEALHQMLRGGIDVRICSSPDLDNPLCASAKYEWVRRHASDELAARTILTKDKTTVRGHILIDDKPEVTGAMTPEWSHVYFDQPWNRGMPGERLLHWSQWSSTVLPLLGAVQVAA